MTIEGMLRRGWFQAVAIIAAIAETAALPAMTLAAKPTASTSARRSGCTTRSGR